MAHMTETVSLKRSPSEREDGNVLGDAEEDFFPVSLWLNDPEVGKLGLEKVEVGEELVLYAKVKATSVSTSANEGQEERHSVTLTLTEASVGPEPKEKSQAERLFGSE